LSTIFIVTGLSENPNGYELTLAEYAEDVYKTGDIRERRSDILGAPPMVFSDQRRLEQELILDALREQASPRNVGRIARSAAGAEVAVGTSKYTPRFRGVFYSAAEIDKIKFNLNDWIYFAGTPADDWENGYIYQYDSTGWKLRPKPADDSTYGWLYLAAVSEMAEGMPDGMFSNVFCKALTAADAFITNLFTHNIQVYPNGSINVQGFTSRDGAAKGFLLDGASGLIETNNIRTKDMDAYGGTFNSITVTGDSTFNGTLNALNVKITGTIASGRQFILKSNNNFIRAYTNLLPVKEIMTYAKGSCMIKLLFPETHFYGLNQGKYKIILANMDNNVTRIARDWTIYNNSLIIIPDVPLDLFSPTRILLYLDTRDTGGDPVSFIQVNSTFELWCKEDPGILGAF